MSRAGIVLVVLLAAAFTALLVVPHRSSTPDVPFTASGVTLHTYGESGELTWEVIAQTGEVTDDEGELRDVEVRFVSSDDTALTAIADTLVRGDEESALSGGVRVERSDGLILTTDRLTWDEREERLRAGAVELTVDGTAWKGSQFEYDLGNDRALIFGGLEGAFPEGMLSADRAEVGEDGLTASGGVTLRLDLAAEEEVDGS